MRYDCISLSEVFFWPNLPMAVAFSGLTRDFLVSFYGNLGEPGLFLRGDAASGEPGLVGPFSFIFSSCCRTNM